MAENKIVSKKVVGPEEAQALTASVAPPGTETPSEQAAPAAKKFVLVKNWNPGEPVVYGPEKEDVAHFVKGKFETEDEKVFEAVLKAGKRFDVVPA